MDLPSGTVTFLFTDIEGSTRLLQALGDEFVHSLDRHSEIVRAAVADHNGVQVNTEGDSFFCVFREAADAAAASVAMVRGLAQEPWPHGEEVRVRVGFHTGEGVLGASDYVGIDVHRAARISAAGHGGQILLSAESYELVNDRLPDGVTTTELGPVSLKDLPEREFLYQLVLPDSQSRFPSLRVGADPRIPLPPLVRPAAAEAPAPVGPATAPSPGGVLTSLPRAWLATLALVAGLLGGVGIGGAMFGGEECEVCVDDEAADAAAQPDAATTAPDPAPSEVPVADAPGAQRITLDPLRSDEAGGGATSDPAAPQEATVIGTWVFTVNVTAVNGSVCQEEIGQTYHREVQITGTHGALVVTGFDNLDDPSDPAWSGSFSNGRLVFSGARAEDDGVTNATFTMDLADDESTLEGSESWTWDWTSQGETDTCVDGQSVVSAVRSP